MTTEDEIETIVRANFPDRRVRNVTRTSRGFKNEAFDVELDGTSVVVKVCTGSDERRFRNGVHVCNLLGANTSIPVAEILTYDTSRELVPDPYFVAENAGESRYDEYDEMPLATRSAVVSELGAILGRIHDTFGFDSSGPDFGGSQDEKRWVDVFESTLEEHRSALADTAFEGVAQRVASELPVILDRVPSRVEPRLLHGDYRIGNVVFRGEEVSAVVDWEETMAGHAAFDVANAELNLVNRFTDEEVTNELTRHFYRGYTETRTLDERFVERRRAYRLCPLLEAMSAFDVWGSELPDDERSRTENRLREQVNEALDRLTDDELLPREQYLYETVCT